MKKFLKIFLIIVVAFVLGKVNLVWAQAAATAVASSTSLENPLDVETVPDFVGNLIKGAISILGAVTLFMFLLGGFYWLTAGGNEEKVKKGTQTMMWAAIGVAIVFSSYFIISGWITGILTF